MGFNSAFKGLIMAIILQKFEVSKLEYSSNCFRDIALY